MADLSPAALAVMAAGTMGNYNVINDPVYRQCIAAVLRAAADQVVPADALYARSCCEFIGERCRVQLLAIAAELDGHG